MCSGDWDGDGVDLWQTLVARSSEVAQPRSEVVYNIKEKPFMAALRLTTVAAITSSSYKWSCVTYPGLATTR